MASAGTWGPTPLTPILRFFSTRGAFARTCAAEIFYFRVSHGRAGLAPGDGAELLRMSRSNSGCGTMIQVG
jgi:hypothetical protein